MPDDECKKLGITYYALAGTKVSEYGRPELMSNIRCKDCIFRGPCLNVFRGSNLKHEPACYLDNMDSPDPLGSYRNMTCGLDPVSRQQRDREARERANRYQTRLF